MTDFTIVIPAYNAERTLEAAVTSVDQQTDTGYEVVIVDDGSTDGTGALADRLCSERTGWRVIHQENRGLPAARNAALGVAQGRWIALLDSDDWYLPGYLARMRELMTSVPDVGLAFVDAWVWDEERRRFGRRGAIAKYRPRPLPEAQWDFFRALMQVNFVYVAACFPRDVALELGGFKESLRAAEDWELWLRIVAAGHRAVGVDERLAIYRHSAGQMSKDPRRMWEGARGALRSALEACDLPPDVRADLVARTERHEASTTTELPRHPARALLGRLTRFSRPVRDYRLRPPRAVSDALGELR